jgi:hypothetical protein
MHATELNRTRAPEAVNNATRFEAHDVARIAAMMRELRDLTQSRRTFVEATRFLQQYAGERDSPSLARNGSEPGTTSEYH